MDNCLIFSNFKIRKNIMNIQKEKLDCYHLIKRDEKFSGPFQN